MLEWLQTYNDILQELSEEDVFTRDGSDGMDSAVFDCKHGKEPSAGKEVSLVALSPQT